MRDNWDLECNNIPINDFIQCVYHQKGPHSRNPRLRDPNAEECLAECWYYEYHIDINFNQTQNAWLSASGELIPGIYSILNHYYA